jgi:hypothetical protein
MIIAILLWMQLFIGDTAYSRSEYDVVVDRNSAAINAVLQDPQLSSSVYQSQQDIVPTVIIVENE